MNNNYPVIYFEDGNIKFINNIIYWYDFLNKKVSYTNIYLSTIFNSYDKYLTSIIINKDEEKLISLLNDINIIDIRKIKFLPYEQCLRISKLEQIGF